jgi:hypothetical protein
VTYPHEPTAVTLEPVPVHIVSSAPELRVPPGQPRHRMEYLTVVLQPLDLVQMLLPQSEDRICAWIQPLDEDIVIGKDPAMVGASNNTVTNVPSPSGALIPATNLQPYPIDSHDAVFAGATVTNANSRVSVTATYRVVD